MTALALAARSIARATARPMIDPNTLEVVGQRRVRLSRQSYAVARALTSPVGRLVTYAELDAAMWPDGKLPNAAAVCRAQVLAALRVALAEADVPARIVCERRVGVRMDVKETHAP